MSKPTLKAMMESVFATAKRMIEEDQDEAGAIFFIIMPNGNLSAYQPSWGSNEEKRAELDALRFSFEKQKVQGYIFCSEGWAVVVEPDEKGVAEWDGVSPAESPERIEVLNVLGVTRDGESHSILAYIKMVDGKRTLERQIEHEKEARTEGDFLSLLTTEKETAH